MITNSGGADGTVHTVHDRAGNVIAEADASGQTSREYVWLPGAGAAGMDLPLAVVDGVNGASPSSITSTPTRLLLGAAIHAAREGRATIAARAARSA